MTSISTNDRILIEQQVMEWGKSTTLAFLLWGFLGMLGAHNFYLGRNGRGTAQAILTCSIFFLVITFIWIIIEAFGIQDAVREHNQAIREELTQAAKKKAKKKARKQKAESS